MKRKILFLTGTRADYGKIKSLMKKVDNHPMFDLHVFVTGMHMLSKYGSTYSEIEKDGFINVHKYINQSSNSSMDIAFSNTILGLSNFVAELKPDLIVIHGDRLEALAGAIVGAFNNIKVAHIEGGEISGTIDESIRHAVTKFAHIHFVANMDAKKRVLQLGEKQESIYEIGSPDIDIMYSNRLPNIYEAKQRYDIVYDDYSIVMYHPVTTEVDNLNRNIKNLVSALIKSNKKYIVIYPNNDEGTDVILDEYKKLHDNPNFKIYPSIRFEYFLTLLRNSKFIIGNSSVGIREAGVYGVPTIDIGNRQQGRYNIIEESNIIHVDEDMQEIENAIHHACTLQVLPKSVFGDGSSDEKFIKVLENKKIWEKNYQKRFIDINLVSTVSNTVI
ncbi:UDP-N-acetylglucosamine 2-epimerase (hydrolyzing) [Salipaludibacillus neizhouensis]|uniref:UDP-N-acetylglucosamine 2-epimerase (Hydrolyzing) n=1 Tax=Salipaludibacillus neizhouensis TaxID=885475 RepID=A0A3A9K4S8_9BACI|nr:UDP-N-acetylglucosamine 2-epimerase [Salipaludibacillus neizhouensis]RKL68054.1 UDP-N-acetylglucosamine 2-epimerase (hydrolyzing) [Salipaludibacillus neizhouensis]